MIIDKMGVYSLSQLGAASTGHQILYVSGTGTAELGYFDDFGIWKKLVDGDVASGGQYHVFGGGGSPVGLKVKTVSGAGLSIIVTRLTA